jgi:hypothetical protein
MWERKLLDLQTSLLTIKPSPELETIIPAEITMQQEARTFLLTGEECEQKLKAAVEEISTIEFQVWIEQVAGLRQFLWAARSSKPYKLLLDCLEYDKELYISRIVTQFRRLVASPFEERYANPNDVPATILALVLLDAGYDRPELLGTANRTLNETFPFRDEHNMFWLPRVLTEPIKS